MAVPWQGGPQRATHPGGGRGRRPASGVLFTSQHSRFYGAPASRRARRGVLITEAADPRYGPDRFLLVVCQTFPRSIPSPPEAGTCTTYDALDRTTTTDGAERFVFDFLDEGVYEVSFEAVENISPTAALYDLQDSTSRETSDYLKN